jgi:hypothetical protein
MGEPLRSSKVVLIPMSSSAVRWGRGSERWPVRWGPDLVTGEGRGSPEGGFHRGTARPEGNGGDRRRPEVEVGDSRFGKVVGTRAVVGVASTERVGGRRRLGGGHQRQGKASAA